MLVLSPAPLGPTIATLSPRCSRTTIVSRLYAVTSIVEAEAGDRDYDGVDLLWRHRW